MKTTFTETAIGHSPFLIVETDKFKTELLTAAFSLPYEPRSSMLCSLLFSVLKQGCEKYPSPELINCRLDDLYDATVGTSYSTAGENASAGVFAECLDSLYIPDGTQVLEGTLDMIRNILTAPLFDGNGLFREDILENEKRALCDKLRAADNNPKSRSQRICNEVMFSGEPYANRILGSVEAINEVTPRILTDYYREFLSSSKLKFIYVGSRGEKVMELCERAFEGIGGSTAELNETIIKKAPSAIRFREESMAVTQGKLTLGFRADIAFDSEDIYAAMVFNDLFGGSPSSKLFRNVREAQSLCYSCSSAYDFTKGALFVRSGISNKNKERVTDEILKQFNEILKGNISDYEFDCSRKSLINYYLQAQDSAYAIENFYRQRLLYGKKITLKEATEKLSSVTREDVIRVATRFAPDTCAFIRGTLMGNCEEDDGNE